jgi:hypothetical protein
MDSEQFVLENISTPCMSVSPQAASLADNNSNKPAFVIWHFRRSDPPSIFTEHFTSTQSRKDVNIHPGMTILEEGLSMSTISLPMRTIVCCPAAVHAR